MHGRAQPLLDPLGRGLTLDLQARHVFRRLPPRREAGSAGENRKRDVEPHRPADVVRFREYTLQPGSRRQAQPRLAAGAAAREHVGDACLQRQRG